MRYGLAILLLCVAPAAPAAAQTSATVNDAEQARGAKIAAALEAMQGGDAAGAIATLDPILAEYEKLYPDAEGSVFCASDTVNTLSVLIAAAAKNKKEVVAIGENWCFALWGKGFALVDLGKLVEALPFVARASAMMPERAQFASELGYVYQALKQWQPSIDSYREAERRARRMTDEAGRNKELRRALFGIAYSQIELGQLDDAEANLKRALEAAPGDKKVLDELQYIRDRRAKAKAS